MKTWRERIAEARERGAARRWWKPRTWPRGMWWPFTKEDGALAGSIKTCAAAEMTENYGLEWDPELFQLGNDLHKAILDGSVDRTDQWFDAIEDRALELKRLGGETRGVS